MNSNRHKISIWRLTVSSLWLLFLLSCSSTNDPNKLGYTAKEAEQLASTYALEIAGDNPIMLVSIEAPADGGGVNRNGRLAKGSQGKWLFGYYSPGITQGLLIEVVNSKTYDNSVPLNNLGSLQEILPNYIDSSDALTIAEQYGGSQLTDVKIILCRLLGEASWPSSNPKKIAWEITYQHNDGSQVRYYIDSYNSVFLGKG